MTHDQLVRDLVRIAVQEAVSSVHDALYEHVSLAPGHCWGQACREAVELACEDFDNNLAYHRRKVDRE